MTINKYELSKFIFNFLPKPIPEELVKGVRRHDFGIRKHEGNERRCVNGPTPVIDPTFIFSKKESVSELDSIEKKMLMSLQTSTTDEEEDDENDTNFDELNLSIQSTSRSHLENQCNHKYNYRKELLDLEKRCRNSINSPDKTPDQNWLRFKQPGESHVSLKYDEVLNLFYDDSKYYKINP